ncbi:MAG TPA: hypothetical protein VK926_01180, partial [Gaiellaceae bacterium]|nr:hypothetical protein [Gaiellaceae bacterium]
QAALATTLADVGKIDEAEQLALDARANAGPEDVSARVESMEALGAVRAAQGQDADAEDLLLSAIALARESEFKVLEIEPLARFAAFLRERGRGDEAEAHESRLAELNVPAASTVRTA